MLITVRKNGEKVMEFMNHADNRLRDSCYIHSSLENFIRIFVMSKLLHNKFNKILLIASHQLRKSETKLYVWHDDISIQTSKRQKVS